jgi:hypothetical protein
MSKKETIPRANYAGTPTVSCYFSEVTVKLLCSSHIIVLGEPGRTPMAADAETPLVTTPIIGFVRYGGLTISARTLFVVPVKRLRKCGGRLRMFRRQVH